MSTAEERFSQFARLLQAATGDRAKLFRGVNSVEVAANEFSPVQKFRSIQAAIDHYARYLPVEFVNPSTEQKGKVQS